MFSPRLLHFFNQVNVFSESLLSKLPFYYTSENLDNQKPVARINPDTFTLAKRQVLPPLQPANMGRNNSLMRTNPFRVHWKRWALKIETFLGPEMSTSAASAIRPKKVVHI
jgi:hypothetical protein